MNLDAVTGTLLGTLIGSTAGTITAIWTAWIAKRSEERRHLRELALQMAIENWRAFCRDYERWRGDNKAAMPNMLDVHYSHALRTLQAYDHAGPITQAEIASSLQTLAAGYRKAMEQDKSDGH